MPKYQVDLENEITGDTIGVQVEAEDEDNALEAARTEAVASYGSTDSDDWELVHGSPYEIAQDDPQYVVAQGSAFEGIQMVGPFDSFEEAQKFAEADTVIGTDWHVVQLKDPNEEEV